MGGLPEHPADRLLLHRHPRDLVADRRPGCDEVIGTSASPLAWDIDPATGLSSFTTNGNNALAVHNWFSNNPFTVGTELATPSPTREYTYPWTNQWLEQRCNPDTTFTSSQRNDIDAARANLFAMHNRSTTGATTWASPRRCGTCSGTTSGSVGSATTRSPATPRPAESPVARHPGSPRGTTPIRSPLVTGSRRSPTCTCGSRSPLFYSRCADGDFDMSVIGHEYGHAITNRMINGPAAGFSSPQGMSASWSDLIADGVPERARLRGAGNPGLHDR